MSNNKDQLNGFKASNKSYAEKNRILNNVRARIITNNPSLSGLLTFVEHQIVRDDDPNFNLLAYTDGNKMYFADLFFSQETPIMSGIVIHEMLHIVFCHVARGRNRLSKLFNIAADAIINDSIGYIQDLNNTNFSSIYLDKDNCVSLDSLFNEVKLTQELRHSLGHWTAESLYELLLNKLKQDLEKEYERSSDKQNSTTLTETDCVTPSTIPSTTSLGPIEKKIEDLLKRLAKKHGMFNGSDINEGGEVDKTEEQVKSAIWTERFNRAKSTGMGSYNILARINPDVYVSKVPWFKQLRKFLVKNCMPQTAVTWSKPSRRMASLASLSRFNSSNRIYMPGVVQKKGLDKMVIIVDTSGSCFNNEEQNMFATEIESIQSCTGVEIRLIFADSQILAEYTIKNDGTSFKDKLKDGRVQLKGGGGTDMRIPFIYAKNKYKPIITVIASDGHTPFPTRKDMLGAGNLIWVCNTNAEIPPECGSVIRITN